MASPAPELSEAGKVEGGSNDSPAMAAEEVSSSNVKSNSTISLIETLGLSQENEKSLQSLLKGVQREIICALEELTTITTYDENLERQYKEVVSENTKLRNDLANTQNELRHLRGKLSIIQMTSSEIREEKARVQLRQKKRFEQEKLLESERAKKHLSTEGTVYVLTVAERARTVNSKGEYIDRRTHNRHSRSSTYPVTQPLPSLSPRRSSPQQGGQTLPPPLVGCACSECNSKQSLGALTFGKKLCQRHLTDQITKSGQQILLGDKVVVKGERLGTIKYIGKLDFDLYDQIYIGVNLDMPVGNSNGTIKGRRYFQCSSNHGVFVKPADIICVTGRKPLSRGTAIPRVRERIPHDLMKLPRVRIRGTSGENSRLLTRQSLASVPSSHSSSTVTRAKSTIRAELESLQERSPYELVDDSVAEMSERIKILSDKRKLQEPPTPPATPTTEQDIIVPSPTLVTPLHPLPPIPETNGSVTPNSVATPSRTTTPLETTLLDMLSDADLGATGFVTASELKTVLTTLGKLSPEEITDLLTQLGVDAEDGVGLPYHTLMPHLLSAIQQNQL